MDAIDNFIVDFNAAQDKAAGREKNHNIYEKRLTNPDKKWKSYWLTPYSMYFYYLRINSNGRLVIHHYFYVDGDVHKPKTWCEIPYDKKGLCDLVTKLAINARPLGRGEIRKKDPRRRAHGNFNKCKWRRKSYVAIFFDEAHWTLRKNPHGKGESAVSFVVRDGAKRGTPNHSFFDATDLEVTMPIRHHKPGGDTTDIRSAIVFVNHMKADDNGRELNDGENQKFIFKIFLDVEAEMEDDPPTVFIIDPGGENGGPSVPPPPDIPPPPPPKVRLS